MSDPTAVITPASQEVDRTPMDRVKRAMSVAKTPETLYSVTFAWRRPIYVQDGIPIDGSHIIGGYLNRTRFDS